MFPLVEYLGSLAFAVGDPLAVAVFLAVGDWQAVEAFQVGVLATLMSCSSA